MPKLLDYVQLDYIWRWGQPEYQVINIIEDGVDTHYVVVSREGLVKVVTEVSVEEDE